jgi:ribosomal protein S21
MIVKDLEKALRKFKRASADKLNDLRKYEAYEKPSVKRRKRKQAAEMRERQRVQEV